jgi:hypothetical protein
MKVLMSWGEGGAQGKCGQRGHNHIIAVELKKQFKRLLKASKALSALIASNLII